MCPSISKNLTICFNLKPTLYKNIITYSCIAKMAYDTGYLKRNYS